MYCTVPLRALLLCTVLYCPTALLPCLSCPVSLHRPGNTSALLVHPLTPDEKRCSQRSPPDPSLTARAASLRCFLHRSSWTEAQGTGALATDVLRKTTSREPRPARIAAHTNRRLQTQTSLRCGPCPRSSVRNPLAPITSPPGAGSLGPQRTHHCTCATAPSELERYCSTETSGALCNTYCTCSTETSGALCCPCCTVLCLSGCFESGPRGYCMNPFPMDPVLCCYGVLNRPVCTTVLYCPVRCCEALYVLYCTVYIVGPAPPVTCTPRPPLSSEHAAPLSPDLQHFRATCGDGRLAPTRSAGSASLVRCRPMDRGVIRILYCTVAL